MEMGEHLGIAAREEKPWAPGVQSVSIKHEAILNFLLINPTAKLREVAEYFGVTQPWLSCIIHSDAFQLRLRERQDLHFDVSVRPMLEKVTAAAELALNRIVELIPVETDLAKLNGVADKALSRLGIGNSAPAPGTVVQVNVGIAADLAKARARIGVKNGSSVSEAGVDFLGQADPVPALPHPQAPHGGAEGGEAL